MAQNPTIAVIIACRNQERYIGRCIRSVLNQSYPKSGFEVIVVNDASTDRSAYALDVFGSEITVLTNDERQGLPRCLNRAIASAPAQFIVRVDGDDYVNRHFLLFLEAFLSENPQVDAVACDYLLVDDREQVVERRRCDEHPIACGVMFRIEQLMDIGLYDDSFEWHEDQDLRIRFTQRYTITRLAMPLYRYRRHTANMTNDVRAMTRHYDRLVAKHGKSALTNRQVS